MIFSTEMEEDLLLQISLLTNLIYSRKQNCLINDQLLINIEKVKHLSTKLMSQNEIMLNHNLETLQISQN